MGVGSSEGAKVGVLEEAPPVLGAEVPSELEAIQVLLTDFLRFEDFGVIVGES